MYIQSSKMMSSKRQSSKWEVLFLQGIHYWNPKEYLLVLSRQLTLWSLFGVTTCTPTHDRHFEEKQGRQLRKDKLFLGGGETLEVVEKRFPSDSRAQYVLANSMKGDTVPEMVMRIRIEETKGVKGNKTMIKVAISNQSKGGRLLSLLKGVVEPGVYVWKKEYCQVSGLNEVFYPIVEQSPLLEKTDTFILMVQQHKLTELPILSSILHQVLQKHPRVHIIGPPSSLLLALTATTQRTAHHLTLPLLPSQGIKGEKVLEREVKEVQSMLYRALNQQNILDIDLIEFLVQSIVDQGFIAIFEEIVQMYYKILLQEELSIPYIRKAILSGFYTQLLPSPIYIFPFTSLFHSLDFHHHFLHRTLLEQLGDHLENTNFGEWTLSDLYQLRGVEYTWTGLDLKDSVLRLFNRHTTPLLPLKAITGLSQLLTAPYQALVWQAEWGAYTVTYPGYCRQIAIAGHHIVDAQLMVPSPHQLVQDQHFRNCYMGGCRGQMRTTGTVAPTVKTKEVKVLKQLLKSLKKHAVNSISKVRLVWKVLTSNNRVDLDINNAQSFSQVPILQNTFALNDAYKSWLANINHQANHDSLISANVSQLYTPVSIENISKQLEVLEKALKEGMELGKEGKGEEEVQEEAKKMTEFVQSIQVLCNSQIKGVLSSIVYLIRSVPSQLKGHQDEVDKVAQLLNSHPLLIRPSALKTSLLSLLTALEHNRFDPRQQQNLEEIDLPHTSTQLQAPTSFIAPTTLQQALAEIRSFKGRYETLRKRMRKQAMCFEYRRLQLRMSWALWQGVKAARVTDRLQSLQRRWWSVTPYLYQLQRVCLGAMQLRMSCSELLQSKSGNGKQVHFMFNGGLRDPLHHIMGYFQMKEVVERSGGEIVGLTVSGAHVISGLLIALGLPPQTIIQQTIAAVELVETNWINPKKTINIEEIYQQKDASRNKTYSLAQLQQHRDNMARLGRKYPALAHLLTQLSNLYPEQPLIPPITLVADYDAAIPDDIIVEKETAIREFMEGLVREGQARKEREREVRENKEMLADKLDTNKIGIRFMIKLAYREEIKECNWLPIHCGRFRQLHLLTKHLALLLTRHGVPPNITLEQFQKSHRSPALHFPLINTTRLQLTLATAHSHPHSPLLHTLMAAMSAPVEYPTQPITTPLSPHQLLRHHIEVADNKVSQPFAEDEYCSSEGIAPLCMHLIRQEISPTTVLVAFAPNMVPILGPSGEKKGEKGEEKRGGESVVSDQAKIKGLDVLGIWWSRSKKLPPTLKKVVFNNLYNSPFLKYYSLLLKHAHHHKQPPLYLSKLNSSPQEVERIGECLMSQGGMIVIEFSPSKEEKGQYILRVVADNLYPPATVLYSKTAISKTTAIRAEKEFPMEVQWIQGQVLHKAEFSLSPPSLSAPFHLTLSHPLPALGTYPNTIPLTLHSPSTIDQHSSILQQLQSIYTSRTLSHITPPQPSRISISRQQQPSGLQRPPTIINSITTPISRRQPSQLSPERGKEGLVGEVVGGVMGEMEEWEMYFQAEEKEEEEEEKSCWCCCK